MASEPLITLHRRRPPAVRLDVLPFAACYLLSAVLYAADVRAALWLCPAALTAHVVVRAR